MELKVSLDPVVERIGRTGKLLDEDFVKKKIEKIKEQNTPVYQKFILNKKLRVIIPSTLALTGFLVFATFSSILGSILILAGASYLASSIVIDKYKYQIFRESSSFINSVQLFYVNRKNKAVRSTVIDILNAKYNFGIDVDIFTKSVNEMAENKHSFYFNEEISLCKIIFEYVKNVGIDKFCETMIKKGIKPTNKHLEHLRKLAKYPRLKQTFDVALKENQTIMKEETEAAKYAERLFYCIIIEKLQFYAYQPSNVK